uniref:AT-rich interactive domain-containing protein 3 n=1 Tax=Eptatretus burgeri TaxID=7764 RepID=A0A8C4Q442_EPTBU
MRLEAVMENLQRQQQARLELIEEQERLERGRELREERERLERGRELQLFHAHQLAAAAAAAQQQQQQQQAALRAALAGPGLGPGGPAGGRLELQRGGVADSSEGESDNDAPGEFAFSRFLPRPIGVSPAAAAAAAGDFPEDRAMTVEDDEEEEEEVERECMPDEEEDEEGMEEGDYPADRAGVAGVGVVVGAGAGVLEKAGPVLPTATVSHQGQATTVEASGPSMSPSDLPHPSQAQDWTYEEQFKQLYELDDDPKRKEFLDDLFTFMQKRGTPVNRIPIMAKQVLDLFTLYKLVTDKGGLVEVINKKIWREITKGLNLPTSITSAAFTLRTQYMKYLYPYECERKGLSSPAELQAAIDSNRREGRRPSFASPLFGYPPPPGPSPTAGLSTTRLHLPGLGNTPSNGTHLSPGPPPLKKEEDCPLSSPRLNHPIALSNQHPATMTQAQAQAQAQALGQLREKLEAGEPPEKKMAAAAASVAMAMAAEEQQRLMQQLLQQNLLAVASQLPMSIKINSREEWQDMALNLSTNGTSSINMSVEINGVLYSGMLFARRPSVSAHGGVSCSGGLSGGASVAGGIGGLGGGGVSTGGSASSSQGSPHDLASPGLGPSHHSHHGKSLPGTHVAQAPNRQSP